jgi:hypothetical protein
VSISCYPREGVAGDEEMGIDAIASAEYGNWFFDRNWDEAAERHA